MLKHLILLPTSTLVNRTQNLVPITLLPRIRRLWVLSRASLSCLHRLVIPIQNLRNTDVWLWLNTCLTPFIFCCDYLTLLNYFLVRVYICDSWGKGHKKDRVQKSTIGSRNTTAIPVFLVQINLWLGSLANLHIAPRPSRAQKGNICYQQPMWTIDLVLIKVNPESAPGPRRHNAWSKNVRNSILLRRHELNRHVELRRKKGKITFGKPQ